VIVLSEWESKAALGPRLPRPREALTRTKEEAAAFARELAGPVVAKASGPSHKSEAGLVRPGLDEQSLAVCWDELASAGDGTVLVAEQVSAELELIAGGVRDPQFGPLVSIGLGGVAAEVFRDTAFILAPPEPDEIEQAIATLRCAPLLEGFRGRPPVDKSALQSIVDAIANLLLTDESVVEVDCNPVLVRGGKPLVVDALVVKR
jgi:acetate---CoA ligase (ADP-forming) subunit beta